MINFTVIKCNQEPWCNLNSRLLKKKPPLKSNEIFLALAYQDCSAQASSSARRGRWMAHPGVWQVWISTFVYKA